MSFPWALWRSGKPYHTVAAEAVRRYPQAQL